MNRSSLYFFLFALPFLVPLETFAQIVSNGDFSANASSFYGEGAPYAGYATPGILDVEDWSQLNSTSSYGIDSPTVTDFAPHGYAYPNSGTPGFDFLFTQDNTTAPSGVFQYITLLPNESYTLTFEAAPRYGYTDPDTGFVMISSGVTTLVNQQVSISDAQSAGPGNDFGFLTYTATFTTTADVSGEGDAVIELAVNPAADSSVSTNGTLDFTNVSIVDNGAAVPEPGVYTLLGFSCLVLALARRRGLLKN